MATYTVGIQVNASFAQAQQLQHALQQLAQTMGIVQQHQQSLNQSLQQHGQQQQNLGNIIQGAVIQAWLKLKGALEIVKLAFQGLKSVWDTVVDAFKKAAEIELVSVRFEGIINNTKRAAEEFKHLKEVAVLSGGLFDTAKLADVAGKLYELGVGFDDLNGLIKGFTELSARSGTDIEAISGSFLRLKEMMEVMSETGRGMQSRQLLAFAREGVPIIQMLSESIGKSREEVIRLFQAGRVTVTQLIDAFVRWGEAHNDVARQATTTVRLIDQIFTRWEKIKKAFAEPILLVIEPILQRILPLEITAEAKAREIGKAVADFIEKLDNLAKSDIWEAFTLGGEIAAKEVGNLIYQGITVAFQLALSVTEQSFQKWLDDFTAKTRAFILVISQALEAIGKLPGGTTRALGVQFGKLTAEETARRAAATQQRIQVPEAPFDIAPLLEQLKQKSQGIFQEGLNKAMGDITVQNALTDTFSEAFKSNDVENALKLTTTQAFTLALGAESPVRDSLTRLLTPPGGLSIGGAPLARPELTGGVREKTVIPTGFQGEDVQTLKELRTQLDSINLGLEGGGSAVEAQLRGFNAIYETINKMVHPSERILELLEQQTDGVDKLTLMWAAHYRERMELEQRWEIMSKAGTLDVADTMRLGIMKLNDSWGSMSDQAVKAIGDIGNALASDISGGLSEILSGTKSLKDGFREMALSIVKDIQHIILQMLVQLAIQRLLGFIGGAALPATASQNAALGPLLAAQPEFQHGGRVFSGAVSGRGTRDTVPAMLAPGEFVVNRDSARKIGYANLNRLNKMEAGGIVRQNRHFYQEAVTPPGDFLWPSTWWQDIHGDGGLPPDLQFPGSDLPIPPSGGGGGGGGGGDGGNLPPGWGLPGGGGFQPWTQNPPGSGPIGGGGGQPRAPISHWQFPTLGVAMPAAAGPGAIGGIAMGKLYMHSMRMQNWAHSQGFGSIGAWMRQTGFTLERGWPGGGRGEAGGQTLGGSGRGMTHNFHTGGIVDSWAEYQSGGTVRSGEGVFTRGQMAALAPAASSNTSVLVQVNDNRTVTDTKTQGTGLSPQDAADIGRLVSQMVDARIARQKRAGGSLYAPRSG